MTTPRFVVAGESLVDVVVPRGSTPERAPGGSPMNVAVGLSRLGLSTLLLTELGDDDLGRLVQRHLADSGVELAEGSVVAGAATSTATAHLDERGAASYDFDLRWELRPRPLPEDATALHVGSLGSVLRPGREAVTDLVRQARERGLLLSFDPNVRPSITPDPEQVRRDVAEVAGAADVVKLSDEDLEFLHPGVAAKDVASALLGTPTRLVVVTFGGSHAAAYSAAGSAEARSRAVGVVDTVGAGDSFMAALVAVVAEHGLDQLDEARLAAYLTAAHQAAAVTVSRRGADPPRRAELPPGWPHVA